MKKSTARISICLHTRYLPVLLIFAIEPGAAPATTAPDAAIEKFVVVTAPSTVLWLRFGGFCAIAKWDPAFGSCRFLKGKGDVGTIRHIERRSGGPPIVQELTARSRSSYTYRAIDGSSGGTFAMRDGAGKGTTRVTWRIVAGPTATPDFREALTSRLGPAVQVALETLARQANGSPSSGGE